MKRGIVLLACALLAASALITLSGAAGIKTISAEEAYAKFVGEWVNMEYVGIIYYPQKLVIKPDYVEEDWSNSTDPQPSALCDIKLKKAWTDRKGNTYCQFFAVYTVWGGMIEEQLVGENFVALMRVDESGKTLEINRRFGKEGGSYFEKIDPNLKPLGGGWYWIYHRK